MRAKQYLKELKRLDTCINQKIQELDELKAAASSIGSIDYSKERVQTSPPQEAPFVKLIPKIIDLEYEINAEIDKYVDEKHLIINQIQNMSNADYISLLYRRYVEYKTFEDIAKEMKYSVRGIYFMHGRALQEFENLYL